MATSKILIDGVGIDLTGDTVTSAADIALGKVGHTNTGEIVTGTHSGGGGGWTRPTEWGERPAEFTAEKALPKEQRTMEALYMLYHNIDTEPDLNRFAGFKVDVSAGTYKVERGHMVGTTFTVDETTSAIADNGWYEKELSTIDREWILFRITPETSGAYINTVSMGSSDSDSARSLSYFKQYVLEVYGRVKATSYYNMRAMFTHHTVCVDVLPNGAFGTSLANMFNSCYYVESIYTTEFDTSNATTMESMFYNCSALTVLNVSSFDTGSVTNTGTMFYGCGALASLDVTGFNTSAVETMAEMFRNCENLAALDVSGFDTSSATLMTGMFYNCWGLSNLDVSGFDTVSVTNMSNIFRACYSLTVLDVSGFDTSAVSKMNDVFNSCNSLSSVTGGAFTKSISFSSASRLTHASAVSILNALATVSATQTVTFNAWTKNQLTAEEIAVATAKGWTVA